MTTYQDLKNFFTAQKFDRFIIVSEGEPRVTKKRKGKLTNAMPPGGVTVAFDPIAKAANAMYIGRGRSPDDALVVDERGKLQITDPNGTYTLKRIFIKKEDEEPYYYGFSNQTLWPLCHVAFEKPEFKKSWYEGYKRVNEQFARAIKEEIKGKTFVWINDYQLAMVPHFLGKERRLSVGMFWHIPWPTWEVFRILPPKKEILESLLQCDLLGFHRGYQARNFLDAVARELEVRIDEETATVHYANHITTVKYLPMGIDADVISSLAIEQKPSDMISHLVQNLLGIKKEENNHVLPLQKNDYSHFFENYRVILGVDRLDYTKGLVLRLRALENFFEKNPGYRGKVLYLGIIAPSREPIPSYRELKRETRQIADEINKKFGTKHWQPINLIYEVFERNEIMGLYQKAAVCLVTPRDDGMNLVSKEFVLASSLSQNPGMLVLSMFAGSAIDLTESLIVNPYDIDQVSAMVKKALEMSKGERIERTRAMAETLKEKNVYEWAEEFVRSTVAAAKK